MPKYTDAKGKEWDIPKWPGGSHKAKVINRALKDSRFYVTEIDTPTGLQSTILYQCWLCQLWIPSAAVAGDHVVQQAVGKSEDRSVAELYESVQDSDWALQLSCNECNSGSRNKKRVKTRSSYKADRKMRAPKPYPPKKPEG
jgi:hypothetical protein